MPDIATLYLKAASDEVKSLPTILQFSSEDRFTKYELCQTLARVIGLLGDKLEASLDGHDPSTETPRDRHMSTEVLAKLGVSVKTCDFEEWWRDELGAFPN